MNATQNAFQLQQALLALSELQQQLSRPLQAKNPAVVPSFAQARLVASTLPQHQQQQQVAIPSLRRQLVAAQVPKPVAAPKVFLTERARFFAFTKVLFRYLKKAKVDDRRAKLVVAKCVRQSQMGLSSSSLVAQLEQELRQCVGDVHWARATLCFNSYCSKLGLSRNAMRAV